MSESLLLDNQLCFLVHRLDRAIGARYRPLLSELDLTYPQYLAMLALWEHGELPVGKLCSLLDLDTGTISPLVKRLEALSLVSRERSRTDERQVNVRLTEKGKNLEERAEAVPGQIASCLLSGEGEYHELKATLQTLIERLEKAQGR